MNKAVALFLFEHGWKQVKIARLFGVNRARINQVVKMFRKKPVGCEVCGAPEKDFCIKLEAKAGEKLIFVCKACCEKLKTMI